MLAAHSPESGVGFTELCGIEIGVLIEHSSTRDAGSTECYRACHPGRALLCKGCRLDGAPPPCGVFLPEHHNKFGGVLQDMWSWQSTPLHGA